ncbi:MAG: head GIN domain-containing protein, partial [Melioribacteraceae bacterium]|nr:head GIN domain-containing protein [Melioribacteraceae bacterium]
RVEIFAESNLMKHIKTRVKKNTLYLSSRKNLRPTEDLMVLISVPELLAIDCSGVNDIVAENINSENFDIDLSGAGSINISGMTGLLKIDVSGAADLMAKELITEDIRIDVSGAANAEVFASNSCKAHVSGAGFIELYGDATDVNMDISGAGSLERR